MNPNQVPQWWVNKIKKMEGTRGVNRPYWDYKQYSGAYGTRARGPNDRYGLEEAERRLRAEAAGNWASVNKFAPNAPDVWKGRLASLSYNAGNKWQTSGLGRAVRAGNWDEAARRFAQYNKAGGKVLPGLVNRRRKELAWTGADGASAVVVSAPTQPMMTAITQGQPPMSGQKKQGLGALFNPQVVAGMAMISDGYMGRSATPGLRMLSQAQNAEEDRAFREQQAQIAQVRQAPLDEARLNLLRAQTQRAGRVATGGNYAKQPVYGTDASGKPVIMQLGPSGEAVKTKLPEGVTVSTGVEKVDLGTRWGMLDRRSGQIVGYMDKDLEGESKAKTVGTERGKAKIKLPMVMDEAKRVERYIDNVLNHPAFSRSTGVFSGYRPSISSSARDFDQRINQLRGKAFVTAFERLKGAGAVTEVEGQAAAQALARLRQADVGSDNFRSALEDFKAELQGLVKLAQQKAGIADQKSQSLAAPASNDPLGIR